MTSDDLITVYCRGTSERRDSEGTASYGFVIYSNTDKLEAQGDEFRSGPGVSNNVAEYGAIIRALEWLADHDCQGKRIELKSSSELAIRQINGDYQINAEALIPLREEVLRLSQQFVVRFVVYCEKGGSEEDRIRMAEAKRHARIARRSIVEYKQVQADLRWKFALSGEPDYVCTITLEHWRGDRWERDQSEPYYERNFGRDYNPIRYNNFRAKFAADATYREEWRVGRKRSGGE